MLRIEQEQELVSDTRLLCMAHAGLNRWQFMDVIATYRSNFNGQGEGRIFISTMLSPGTMEALQRLLKQTAESVHSLHQQDEKLPLEQRHGISVVLAARHWELQAFTALRRTV